MCVLIHITSCKQLSKREIKFVLFIFYRYYLHLNMKGMSRGTTVQHKKDISVCHMQTKETKFKLNSLTNLYDWNLMMKSLNTGNVSHMKSLNTGNLSLYTRTIFIVWTCKHIHLHSVSLNYVFCWRMRI